MRDRPGNHASEADIAGLYLHAIERRRISAHEVFAPWRAGQVGCETIFAETHTAPAVAINIDEQYLGSPLFVRSIG